MAYPDAVVALFARFGFEEVSATEGPNVPTARLLELAKALKEELDYQFFVYCAAAHFPGKAPENEDEEGTPGHFVVAYRLRKVGQDSNSVPFYTTIGLDESCPSLTPLFAGADWQEREQFDLVGVHFTDHPDLRRIMMPEDWPGHPLQRDYAIDTAHHPWR